MTPHSQDRLFPPFPAVLAACAAFGFYMAAVIAPNYLIERYGFVDVAWGPWWTLMAPAAVYAVGVALVARDILHDIVGLPGVILAIIFGSIVSAQIADPQIALASFAAFVLSEGLDLAIYQRLRARGWARAALLSSLVGALVDSVVFLVIAYRSLEFLPGQWVGKAVAIVIFVGLGAAARRVVFTGRQVPAAAV